MYALRAASLALLLVAASAAFAQDEAVPAIETITSHGADVGLRIFEPAAPSTRPRGAIVLFHGGGWNEGEAGWMDGIATQYAGLGMVAVSVDYRLSRNGVTPFDAVTDAWNAIRWVRREAARLNVDPGRVAALGTSAGAHLAASAAIFDEPFGSDVSSVPDALVLRSPAIAVEASSWFQQLVGGTAQAAALSPALHVREGLPPMLLLQGEEDNVTPAADAHAFCERMRTKGNTCELKVYPGVGQLWTRNLASQEIPDYEAIDREVGRDAGEAGVAFLEALGFIERTTAP